MTNTENKDDFIGVSLLCTIGENNSKYILLAAIKAKSLAVRWAMNFVGCCGYQTSAVRFDASNGFRRLLCNPKQHTNASVLGAGMVLKSK